MSTSSSHQLLLPIFDSLPADRRAETLTNDQVADCLAEVADRLAEQGADMFRTRAYSSAAKTVRGLTRPLGEIVESEGIAGLMTLDGVGQSLARTLDLLVRTGRCSLLERLRRSSSPEALLTTVADIGPALAKRIHEELGVETLADLEAACLDGRLEQLPGIGRKRIRAVRESLAGRRRSAGSKASTQRVSIDEPSVADLLDIDEQYRHDAQNERLPLVAPRSFNPTGAAWLPVLHTTRHGRQYTAMYSNSARAHELGMTRDWVIIVSQRKDRPGRWTVITGAFGETRGRRIVRGREDECVEHYGPHRRLPR